MTPGNRLPFSRGFETRPRRIGCTYGLASRIQSTASRPNGFAITAPRDRPIQVWLRLVVARAKFRVVRVAAILLAAGTSVRAGVDSMSGVYSADRVVFDVIFSDPHRFDQQWDFQLFVDADGNRQSGYGRGFERVVRGVRSGGGCVSLVNAVGGDGADGWGPTVDQVALQLIGDRHVRFQIPLSRDGIANGAFGFRFETYYAGVLVEPVIDGGTVPGNGPVLFECDCIADCTGRVCGFDGCGGSCGTCGAEETCNPLSGQCERCAPDCGSRDCGPDGCGGSCGTCGAEEMCNPLSGQCEGCAPDCGSRDCGPDGCGGSCGTCAPPDECVDSIGRCMDLCREDTDLDGTPDCADLCPGSDDALDADRNGIPDGCETGEADPLLFLRFEGNTLDDSGNGHDGAWSGSAAYTGDGQTGRAALFDGLNHIAIENTAGLAVNGQFTLACWLRLQAFGNVTENATIIDTTTQSGPRTGYRFFLRGADHALRVELWSDGLLVFAMDGTKSDWRMGSWYHVAGTFDTNGTLENYQSGRLYVDGVLDGQNASRGGRGAGTAPTATIGRFLRGELDDLGVWNRAFLQRDVQALFAGESPLDSCRVDSDGDGIADCEDGCRLDPFKSEPGDCGCGGADDDSDGDAVADCIDRCPGFDDRIDANENGLPDGCDGPADSLLFLRFEGDARDESGRGHDGFWEGSERYVSDGAKGRAGSFDGSSRVALRSARTLDVVDRFTLAGWIRFRTLAPANDFPFVIDTASGGWPRSGYDLFFRKQDRVLQVEFWNRGAVVFSMESTKDDWEPGLWYHVAAVFDSNGGLEEGHSGRLYVNGVVDATSSWGGGSGDGVSDSAQVGASFDGDLDEIGIWRRALSSPEIRALAGIVPPMGPCAVGPGDGARDCNGNGFADACDIADATSADCNEDLIPDECEPLFLGEGPRYLAVRPESGSGPIALRITGDSGDPRVSCVSMYIQADGTLGTTAFFQTPDEWCVVHVTDEVILPDTTYHLQIDGGAPGDPDLSDPVAASTWVWGDANDDGSTDADDVALAVEGFQGVFYDTGSPCTSAAQCRNVAPHHRCNRAVGFCVSATVSNLDLTNPEFLCLPNGIVDFADIAEHLDASGSETGFCSVPCP